MRARGDGRRRLLVVTVAVVIAGACSTTRRPIVGRDIAVERAHTIVPHQTAAADVRTWFGAPDVVLRFTDGTQEYRYTYTGWIDRKIVVMPGAHADTEKEHEALWIRIDGEMVIAVTYTNTADPEKNFSK